MVAAGQIVIKSQQINSVADTLPVRFTDEVAVHTMAQRLSRRMNDFPNLFSGEFPCYVKFSQPA